MLGESRFRYKDELSVSQAGWRLCKRTPSVDVEKTSASTTESSVNPLQRSSRSLLQEKTHVSLGIRHHPVVDAPVFSTSSEGVLDPKCMKYGISNLYGGLIIKD